MKYYSSYEDIKKLVENYAFLIIVIFCLIFSWLLHENLIRLTVLIGSIILSLAVIFLNEFLKNKTDEFKAIISFIAIIFFVAISFSEIQSNNAIALQGNIFSGIFFVYGFYGLILKIKKNKNKH